MQCEKYMNPHFVFRHAVAKNSCSIEVVVKILLFRFIFFDIRYIKHAAISI